MTDGTRENDPPSLCVRWSVIWAITSVIGLVLVIAFAMALYLKAPIERELVVPSGADIPSHLWRVRLVTAQGLNELFTSAPLTIQTNPDRLGLPILGSILSGLSVTPWRLMYVTAAVAAAVAAASAWGLSRAVIEPRWAGPIYALAVVSSTSFSLTSRAYLDNALAEGLMLAVATAALLAAAGRGATFAGVVLLAGTLVMHWPTGTLFGAVLTLFTVGLLPSALADRRAGRPLTSTAAARVGTIAVAGLGIGGVPLFLAPGANTPTQGPGTLFRINVKRLLPTYRLNIKLPLAAVGAAALAFLDPKVPRRRTLLLYTVWLLPLGIAALAYQQGRPIPLMRFFGTALALPLLGATAFTALISLASRITRVKALDAALAIIAVGLVAVALWGSTTAAANNVKGTTPSVASIELEPIRAADAFIAVVQPRAAVFVVDGPTRSFRRLRMLARGTLLDRIHVFPGTPAQLFERAGRPGGPSPDEISDEGFSGRRAVIEADAVEAMREPDAVALVVRPYYGDYDRLAKDPRNVEIADGVLLLRPESRPPIVQTTPLSPPPTSALISATLIAFGALVAAGSGWSFALFRQSWELRLALAPAMGMAVLVLAGSALGLAGVQTGHRPGLLIWIGVTAAGWVAALWVPSGSRPEEAYAAEEPSM
jgi:peptidoglycan/LPS O-acetylase OafA/YrhL